MASKQELKLVERKGAVGARCDNVSEWVESTTRIILGLGALGTSILSKDGMSGVMRNQLKDYKRLSDILLTAPTEPILSISSKVYLKKMTVYTAQIRAFKDTLAIQAGGEAKILAAASACTTIVNTVTHTLWKTIETEIPAIKAALEEHDPWVLWKTVHKRRRRGRRPTTWSTSSRRWRPPRARRGRTRASRST